MELFNKENARAEKTIFVKYGDDFDGYFKLITEKQLKDKELWVLLIRQFSARYDGNDGGWRGEFWGKLMRGASLVYAYNRDEELYEILCSSVVSLIAQADGLGRISSYSPNREFFGWDVWSRKYVMLGLEYFYEICKCEDLKSKIIFALCKHADYMVERIGEEDGKISINDTSSFWRGVNSVSIIQPFVKLYSMTNDYRYLKFAKSLIKGQNIDGENIFNIAYKNQIFPFEYPTNKAYELISCFEGLLDYFDVTREEKCLTACKQFADEILKTDFTLIGGTGCEDELFDNATKKQVIQTPIHKQETCVTVTLTKFLATLYRHTDDVKYLDAIERAFLNVYLGALRDGEIYGTTELPMFYSYSPIFLNPRWTLMGGRRNLSAYASFGCCIAIGAAGLGMMPGIGAMGNKDGVTLNFLFAGDYVMETENGEVKFSVSTKYPRDGEITVIFESAPRDGISLRARKPEWVKDLDVSGSEYIIQDGYVCFTKKFHARDSVILRLDMPITLTQSESVNEEVANLVALAKGSIVLCADSNETDLRKPYDILTDERDNAVYKNISDGEYAISLKDGGELLMREYRNTGKDYINPRDISVWLFRK